MTVDGIGRRGICYVSVSSPVDAAAAAYVGVRRLVSDGEADMRHVELLRRVIKLGHRRRRYYVSPFMVVGSAFTVDGRFFGETELVNGRSGKLGCNVRPDFKEVNKLVVTDERILC